MASTVLDNDFVELYDCIKHVGDRFRTVAEFFRSTIAVSVKHTLNDTSKTVESSSDRYQRVRTDSFQARQSAQSLFQKYSNAVQASEAEIRLWLEAIGGDEEEEAEKDKGENNNSDPLSMTPWEKALHRFGTDSPEETKRLVQKLKVVLSLETEYIDAVRKENNKVSLSQEMETVALGKIQETEQDRISLLATSVVTKVFLSEIDTKTKKLPTPLPVDDSSFDDFERKGMELLAGFNAGLFKQQPLPYEPGMGKMEAETMGLSPEVGTLRDQVKTAFANHEKRIKATQTIHKLLEEIQELARQSSSELTSRTQAQLGNQESSSSRSVMGARSGHLWLETVNTFQYEAKLISDVAFACKKLRNPKVENWMTNAPKSLRNEMELDDAAWKHVSDSSRAEMKAESRYEQSRGQAEKSRSRANSRGLSSAGSYDSGDKSASSSGDNASTEAPNSPFRLFKGRGEVLKQAFGQIPDDQREEKDKVAFEEAVAAKKEAVMAYKAYTTTRIQKLESQDKVGWDELKGIIQQILKTATTLSEARKETLETKMADEIKTSFPLLPSDLNDWLVTVNERLVQKETASSSNQATGEVEYSLSIKCAKTDSIQKLLAMTEDVASLPLKRIEKNEPESAALSKPIRSTKSFDNAVDSKLQHSQSLSPVPPSKPKISKSISEVTSHSPTRTQQPERKNESQRDLNIQAFKKKFWSKKPEGEKPPEINEIFACSYRPKEKSAFLTPNLHGRCFTTSESLYFLSWDNKSFILSWNDILSAEKEKGLMGSAIENTLAVSYRSDESDSVFVLSRLDSGDEVLTHLQRHIDAKQTTSRLAGPNRTEDHDSSLPPVPPDAVLKDMEVVVSKNIKGTNINSVYEKVWKDPPGQQSFYESWLVDEETFDITTEDWEYAEKDAPFTNPWCGTKGETYTQKRLVTFKFKRTTHLYIGPPIAFVKQMHYLRVEGDDKIVLAIEATFEGIPYSDTFGVEMRWVARRIGSSEVKVEVGLFVLFKKGTMLKSQIRAGTISETKNVHVRLFNAVKKACTVPGETEVEEAEEDEEPAKEEEAGILATLRAIIPKSLRQADTTTSAAALIAAIFVARYFLNSLGGSGQANVARLEMQVGDLQDEVRSLRESVDLLVELLNKR
ncbi:MAG: hypothetical protein SGILL_004588 [Bacillariaceae sp.]